MSGENLLGVDMPKYLLLHLVLRIRVGAGFVKPVPIGRASRPLENKLYTRGSVVLIEYRDLVRDHRVSA